MEIAYCSGLSVVRNTDCDFSHFGTEVFQPEAKHLRLEPNLLRRFAIVVLKSLPGWRGSKVIVHYDPQSERIALGQSIFDILPIG